MGSKKILLQMLRKADDNTELKDYAKEKKYDNSK